MNNTRRLRNLAAAIRDIHLQSLGDGAGDDPRLWLQRIGKLLTEGRCYSRLLRDRVDSVTRGMSVENHYERLQATAILFAQSCGWSVTSDTSTADANADLARRVADQVEEYADAEADEAPMIVADDGGVMTTPEIAEYASCSADKVVKSIKGGDLKGIAPAKKGGRASYSAYKRDVDAWIGAGKPTTEKKL